VKSLNDSMNSNLVDDVTGASVEAFLLTNRLSTSGSSIRSDKSLLADGSRRDKVRTFYLLSALGMTQTTIIFKHLTFVFLEWVQWPLKTLQLQRKALSKGLVFVEQSNMKLPAIRPDVHSATAKIVPKHPGHLSWRIGGLAKT